MRQPGKVVRPDSGHSCAAHTRTAEFAAAFDELLVEAGTARTAVMCSESVWWRCHRRLISDALVVRGLQVLHILGPNRADPHELDANARVLPGGRLLYDGIPGDQPSLFEDVSGS